MYPLNQFETIRAESQSRHGVAIAYLKAQVGEGVEYANEVARAVVSDAGGFFQLREMPEEFAGAVGDGVTLCVVSETEAQALTGHLEQFARAVPQGETGLRRLSLYAVYAGGSLRRRRGLFVLDYQQGGETLTHGALQPGIVPRFWKAALHSSAPLQDRLVGAAALAGGAALGLPTSGVAFFLASAPNEDGGGILVTFARAPGTQDLEASLTRASVN